MHDGTPSADEAAFRRLIAHYSGNPDNPEDRLQAFVRAAREDDIEGHFLCPRHIENHFACREVDGSPMPGYVRRACEKHASLAA